MLEVDLTGSPSSSAGNIPTSSPPHFRKSFSDLGALMDDLPTSPSSFPSNTPVACGWMKKRGWVNKGWKRRYFVLFPDAEGRGPSLFYFISPSMAIRMYKHGEPAHRVCVLRIYF